MHFPLVNVTAVVLGLIISLVGAILVIVAAFRQSVVWGLVVIFAPFGNLVYTCVHWAEARIGFLIGVAGAVICVAGAATIPGFQEQVWKAAKLQAAIKAPAPAEKKSPDLAAQILEHRQRLEALQAAFAQDGVELTKQYQALDAQRKALQPGDTAAITKFNETAATYQARNAARKQMQQQIETTQKELDMLIETRNHAATPPPAAVQKVALGRS